MQTQEIYHAVKSFILDVTNGLTVINVPYDYVLFVYATNVSCVTLKTSFTIILVSFIPPHHT